MTPDMSRIIRLPINEPVTPAEIEVLSHEVFLAGPASGECGMRGCRTCFHQGKAAPLRLFPEQAADLTAFRRYGCGFWSNKVGSGKSTTAMLIAAEALAIDPSTRVLLLVPASVVRQFVQRDIPWGRSHLVGRIDNWVNLQSKSASWRREIAKAKNPGVYIMPYSQLSQEDARVLLEYIDAELVIADECQHLKGDNAKQRRFWEWIESYEKRGLETPIGCGMSGTTQTSSPSDYHRTIRWCLGRLSPLPKRVMEAQHWSAVLRATSDKCPDWCPGPPSKACTHRDMNADQYDRMEPLLQFARSHFPTEQDHEEDCPRRGGCDCPKAATGTSIRAVRAAYRLRLRSCPGVVPMGEDDLGISMEISNLDLGEPPARVLDMLDAVKRDWLAPDGRILTYSLEQHQVFSQLTAGFWLRHFWPDSHPKLKEIKKAHRLREDYHKALSGAGGFFASAVSRRMKLDTPRQVGRHHAQHGATAPEFDWVYQAWTDWKAVDSQLGPQEKPEKVMLSELIMVDDYKIKAAVKWAKAHKAGIIWCEHTLFADAVFRAVEAAGLSVLRKRAGSSWMRSDGSENFVCVAGRKAHYEGKNLQDHRHQLLIQWPRPQSHMEQLLGRLHRHGQQAERLVVNTARVTDFDHMLVCATLWDTVYDKETQGGDKKLLLADWDPLPLEYPPNFLRERGFRLADQGGGDEDEEDEDE